MVNGVIAKGMIDTGCSAEAVVNPSFVERASLITKKSKNKHQVILGDGDSVINIEHHVRAMDISVPGYCRRSLDVAIMPLGEFDVILGLPWLKKLENSSDTSELRWNLNKNYIKTSIKGVNITLSGNSGMQYTQSKYSRKFLNKITTRNSKEEIGAELENGLMIMIDWRDKNNPVIIRTINDDEYIKVGEKDTSEDIPPLSKEVSTEYDKTSKRGEKVNVYSSQKQGNWRSNAIDSYMYTSQEHISDLHGNDNRHFEYFIPKEPDPKADITDEEVFTRVEPGKNTEAELKGVSPALCKRIKQHGKVFKDWIKVEELPHRGSADVRFRFKDPTPYSGKPYRLSPKESTALGEILEEMLRKGIIRPSNSPWGAPVFLVPKATGGYILCADYRILNSKLVAESYCLPASDMLFDRLQSAKYFTLQDCTWGYHQLRYEKESIPATAIRTHMGTFEFLVLNFGPSTGPAAWQRFIEQVLRPFLGKFCFIFLDDLIIFSNSQEEHLEHLQIIWKKLHANQIFLRLAKCKFMKTKIQYLGWVVENGNL